MLLQIVKGKNPTKLIITLLLLCAVGFVLAMGVSPASSIALAEEVSNNAINVTIDDCVDTEIKLGSYDGDVWQNNLTASKTAEGALNETATATASAEQTISFKLGSDDNSPIRKAIESKRLSARLKVDSVNTFTTTSGTNINNNAKYRVSGSMGSYPTNGEYATLVTKGATANTGGEATVVELNKSGYVTSEGVVDTEAQYQKLSAGDNANPYVVTVEFIATTSATAQASGITKPVASCNLECAVTFTLELKFENVQFTLKINSNGKVMNGDEEVPAGTVELGFNTPLDSYIAVPAENHYFVGWLEANESKYTESLVLSYGNVTNSVEVPSGQKIDYTAQFRSLSAVITGVSNIQEGYVYSGIGQKVGPIVRDDLITGQYWVVHQYTCLNGTGIDGNGTMEFIYGNHNNVTALYQPETVFAGTYRYTAKLYYKGNTNQDGSVALGDSIGSYVEEFTIGKNNPIFEIMHGTETIRNTDVLENGIELNIALGETLGGTFDLNSPNAINSKLASERVPGSAEFMYKENESDAEYLEVGDNYLFDINPNRVFVIRFTPTVGDNYNYVDVKVSVNIISKIVFEGIGAGSGIGNFAGAVSIVNYPDATSQAIKVSLSATLENTTNRYFFAGWRLAQPTDASATTYGDYKFILTPNDAKAPANNPWEYDYYIEAKFPVLEKDEQGVVSPEAQAAYDEALAERKAYLLLMSRAKFQAVFIEDVTASFDTTASAYKISVKYNGEEQGKTPTFKPVVTGIIYTDLSYKKDGNAIVGLPKEIGTYELTYNIVNSAMGENDVLGTKTIIYEIAQNVVSIEFLKDYSALAGGYNETTGWAKQTFYNLSVNNLVAGGADAYYYSVDGGISWTQISGTITDGRHCKISFNTPEVVNDSVVNYYTFKAEKDGVVIAQSATNALLSKVDTTTPSIENVALTEGKVSDIDTWYNSPYVFTATVAYGGSGAVIQAKYGSSAYVTVGSDIAFIHADDATGTTSGRNVTFTVDREFSGSVTFRIMSAVGNATEVATQYVINIDMSNPTIAQGVRNQVANANGWINKETEVSFAIGDQGGADIASVTCVSSLGETVPVTKSQSGSNYSITIDDSATYIVTAIDKAGNRTQRTYSANIDVEDISYELAVDSYQAGVWTNVNAVVKFNATIGASGAKLYYAVSSTEDGKYSDYAPCGEFISQIDTNAEVTQTILLSHEIVATINEISYYKFKIETRSGKTMEIAFGAVNIDVMAPSYTLETNLNDYQNNNWSYETITVKFSVEDTVGNVNSGVKSVTVDNGASLNDLGNGKYTFVIEKCTEYTVSIEDTAGNAYTKIIKANVDVVAPSLQIKAYVGGGNPEDVTQEPTGTYDEYDFVSWITAAQQEPWVRIEFTINITASGSELQYSNDGGQSWKRLVDQTFIPEEGAIEGTVTARAYLTEEQNKSYVFRLVAGSGRAFEFNPLVGETAYVRIDHNAPVLNTQAFFVNAKEFPATERWANDDVTWTVQLKDTVLGSGINPESVALYEYAITIDEGAIKADVNREAATLCEMTLLSAVTNTYTYVFEDYKQYVLEFTDYAGNKYVSEVVRPLIDKTSGFTFDVAATVLDTNNGGFSVELDVFNSTYGWLSNKQYVQFIGTIDMKGVEVGPSGIGMEFSIDGGLTWHSSANVNGVDQNVRGFGATGLDYVLNADVSQSYSYKLRGVTGAGTAVEAGGEYLVRIEKESPSLDVELNHADNSTYTQGVWTNQDLTFTIRAAIAAAGGKLYYATGTDIDSIAQEDWIIAPDWSDLAANNKEAVKYVLNVEKSTNAKYFFRLVSNRYALSGTQVIYAEAKTDVGFEVKLDKDPITVDVEAKRGDTVIENGNWAYIDGANYVNVIPTIKVGESGIASVQRKVLIDGVWSMYEDVVTDKYATILDEDTQKLRSYVYKVTSVSGMVTESEEFVIGIDSITPEFDTPAITGDKIPEGSPSAGWYISNVDVNINVTNAQNIVSKYSVYYQYAINNTENWSEWVLVNDTKFVLEDNSIIGGSDYKYKFKVVSGSGLEKVTDEKYLPIDTNTYSATAKLTVNGVLASEERVYATVTGENSQLHRGDSTVIDIRASYVTYQVGEDIITRNYYIKSVNYLNGDVNVGNGEWNYDQKIANISKSITIDGSNYVVNVTMYKEVALVYDNERQALQSGTAINVSATIEEPGFQALYGAEGEEAIQLIAKYKNATDANDTFTEKRPQSMDIGFYNVLFETKAGYEDYVIINPTTSLTLVYYATSGTEADPFEISNAKDLSYVDAYMAEGTQNDYLGANRRKAHFIQLANVDLGKSFTALKESFLGVYNGNGFELYYDDTYTTKESFAIFKEIDGGTIRNLGVNLKHVRAENLAEGSNVALIVAKLINGSLYNSYALGNITTSGQKINVGGLIGYAYNSFISGCFADVAINVNASNGNFGGVAGYMKNAVASGVYVVSSIVLTDCVNPADDDGTLEAGVELAYAGSVAGQWVSEEFSLPTIIPSTYYLDGSVSYDGSAEEALACGNDAPVDQLYYVASKFSRFGECDEKIINVTTLDGETTIKSVTVEELALKRIEDATQDLDVIGNGTQSNPFLVNSDEQLALIDTFPWAYFKQTQDITLGAIEGYAYNKPFIGEYDGNGYVIEGATMQSVSHGHIGLFGVVKGTIKNLVIKSIEVNVDASDVVYVGGVAGLLEGADARIENVTITGTISVNATSDVVYVGSVVGVAIKATLQDVITLASVNVNGKNAVVGAAVGQVQGANTLTNVASLASLNAYYSNRADVGTIIGATRANLDEKSTLTNVHYLFSSAYANGASLLTEIGYYGDETVEKKGSWMTYSELTALVIGGKAVIEHLNGLYPFDGAGDGSAQNPFLVDSYKDLMLIGNYMYANFRLTDNIVIGDLNDDGKLDVNDGYKYDYHVIGNGSVFTGTLDGNKYSILGLSDSLFAINAGTIRDITLNMNYRVYASEKDIPASEKITVAGSSEYYTSAKVAEANQESVFGAIAVINREGGRIIRASVTGNVSVRTNGRSRVILGGLVGIDVGGEIIASQVSATILARASSTKIGGVVGEIKANDKALSQIATNHVYSTIDVGGGNVIAGVFVGSVSIGSTYQPAYEGATATLTINGEQSTHNEGYRVK